MLNKAPVEILTQIVELLSRNDICKLASTCKHMYSTCLPTLYHHLELGHHIHMRQLLVGISTQPLLRQSILSHTKKLTLVSKQNGNRWRIKDIMQTLGSFSKVNMLIFRDFHKLSTDTVHQIASILPQLRHIQFEYCQLMSMPKRSIISSQHCTHTSNKPVQNVSSKNYHIDKMTFIWTDFMQRPATAILLPQITRLELGSNRNKFDEANGALVQSLHIQCPNITHLAISLPQVAENALCGIIARYGKQLQYLSIRCGGPRVLSTIADCASGLEILALRYSGGINSASTTAGISEEERDIGLSLLQVVQNCIQLEKLEIISFDLETDVPHAIWESIVASNQEEKNITKMVRAQEALMNHSRKVAEKKDSNYSALDRRPARRNIWFYNVSEEALAQRHYHNSSLGLYQQQPNRRKLESLVLSQKELFEARSRHNILDSF